VASFVEVGGHAGDEGNFEALYETYKHDVQRLASYLLKNATDAEDAAQTVFMNVLRALRQGVTPADPRAWLLAITRNVCFSRGRAAAARPDWVELDHETASQPSDDQGPTADEIVGALARMLPNQRTALILRDFRGVSRTEISDLMSLSAVSVEALLTRARAAFREELEAGDQPFVCAETRELVEQQLDGLITVADRHSLRTHLRHCSPCSSLARAVRSSRSKVAGLIFWPVDLISRLAGAFSQAPTVVHVAAAITSTAAVATVAIPVAITNGPAAAHVEGRTAPAPAAVSNTATPHAAPAATPSVSAIRLVPRIASHRAATAPAHKSTHARTHAARTVQHPKAATAAAAVTARNDAPTPVTAPAHGAPTTTGSVQTPAMQAAHPATSPVGRPVATAPRSISPRSISPSAKPHAKPKPSPAKKASKRRGNGRHSSQPPDRMPSSSPPAATLPPSDNGASDGAGPGFAPGAVVSPAVVPAAPAGSSGQGSNTNASGNGDDSGSSNGNGHHKHKK